MNRLSRCVLAAVIATSVSVLPNSASARIVVEGTRVFLNEGAKEVTVRVHNRAPEAALAQVWVSEYGSNAGPHEAQTPFVALPPLVRIDSDKKQVLRLRFLGADLPADRESVFWLNILDVPSRIAGEDAPQAQIQVAVRNQLKLFYRPVSLKGKTSAGAAAALQWSVVPQGAGWALQARNNSPFHVNTASATVMVNGRVVEARDVDMVKPMSVEQFPLPGVSARPSANEVQFKFINESGGVAELSAALSDA
ncbi:fimbria/pilus periplasmic chaperone [Stenotrophomonas maltophilia]|nr:fimbria/pilus periplasmic chaperone [Stenotrophomonas maltophilia]